MIGANVFLVLGEFMNVAAAEALLCFLLYGNAIVCQQGSPHNYQMCRDIGLVSTNFTTEVVALKEIGTNVLKPHELGLEYLPRIDASCMMEKFNVNDVVKLDQIFLMCKKLDVQESGDNLCATLLLLLVKCSLGQNKRKLALRVECTYDYHFRLKHAHCKYISVFEFVMAIFNTKNYRIGHSGLLFVVNVVRQELGSEKFVALQNLLISYINNLLYKKRAVLAFPMPQQQEVMIVVPVEKTACCYLQQVVYGKAWEFKNRQGPNQIQKKD